MTTMTTFTANLFFMKGKTMTNHNEAECDTETAALRKLVGAGKGVSGDKLIAAAWDAIRTIDEGN